jgi:hypothetical protein
MRVFVVPALKRWAMVTLDCGAITMKTATERRNYTDLKSIHVTAERRGLLKIAQRFSAGNPGHSQIEVPQGRKNGCCGSRGGCHNKHWRDDRSILPK